MLWVSCTLNAYSVPVFQQFSDTQLAKIADVLEEVHIQCSTCVFINMVSLCGIGFLRRWRVHHSSRLGW